jgi:hypothetical protein
MPEQSSEAAEVRLTAADAAELADFLAFLGRWLGSSEDTELLAASLHRFAGHYDLPSLQVDLARFAVMVKPRGNEGSF